MVHPPRKPGRWSPNTHVCPSPGELVQRIFKSLNKFCSIRWGKTETRNGKGRGCVVRLRLQFRTSCLPLPEVTAHLGAQPARVQARKQASQPLARKAGAEPAFTWAFLMPVPCLVFLKLLHVNLPAPAGRNSNVPGAA